MAGDDDDNGKLSEEELEPLEEELSPDDITEPNEAADPAAVVQAKVPDDIRARYEVLCRDVQEVQAKMGELGFADKEKRPVPG
jgi:hypothetical protein